MVFEVLLNASLILFGLGIVYKLHTWFSLKVGIWAKNISYTERVLCALKGIFRTIFSPKILLLLKAFLSDINSTGEFSEAPNESEALMAIPSIAAA